jgi:hypothetical protein
MKKLIALCIIASFCFLVAFIGCKKNGTITYHSQGIITLNPGCCPTCDCAALYGGYSIRFNSDTATLYQISNDISKFGINISSKFPVNVVADWQPDVAIKTGQYVTIIKLTVIN